MTLGFELRFGDGASGGDLLAILRSLEIEEHADLPGAFELTLPVNTNGAIGSEDLTVLGDEAVQPYSPMSVVVTGDRGDECIFDGYVLAHRIHLDHGTTNASVRIWGQDATCLMNLEERVEQHEGTDAEIANRIFERHGFTGASGNADGDQSKHDAKRHTLVQRSTDAQFLRSRARRTGRVFRVACGKRPGDRVGHFAFPDLSASPSLTMVLNPPEAANVDFVDISWDAARPTAVEASALLAAAETVDGAATASGMRLLDARSLAEFTGSEDRTMTALLTAHVDTVEELKLRSRSLLAESEWFVRCDGEADLEQLRDVPRVGEIVQLDGAGALHSGHYLVWSVRHSISRTTHRIRFSLVRNAVGRS